LVVPEECDERAPLTGPFAPAPSWCSARSLAYAIYTSGTTGRPKGVLIEHRGVVNLITSGIDRFAVTPSDRMSQNSSPAYDSSVEEIWLAFGAGAALVVMDDATVRSGPDLPAWLRRERVTILCPPPTLLRTMACRAPREELPALRMCYVGGEPLSQDLADGWGGVLRLENGYGPTECTVTVVRGQVHPGEPVTIGAPVPPHAAHVLGEDLQPVKRGEHGELCISGPGLARGYLGLPELTEERFPTLPGLGRIYRTGDLVSEDQRGLLHYHGRIDAQVKVRGYRIELEAIEAVLARCEGVREVAVVARGEEPARALVAMVVVEDGHVEVDDAALSASVAAALPAYMVPTKFERRAELPRSVGGKVDRAALAATEPRATSEAAPSPVGGALRDVVASAFVAALGLPPEDVSDAQDFFSCGGNSLRAAMLVSQLRGDERLQGIAVRDVYASPTIAGLVAVARTRGGPARARVDARGQHGSLGGSITRSTALHVAFLVTQWFVAACALWAMAAYVFPWLLELSIGVLLFVLPLLAPALRVSGGAAGVLGAVVAKRALIGRYRAGSTPAWGGLRARHWLVTRFASWIPWGLFEGTEMTSVVLRMLGARVGRRVHFQRGVALQGGGWDLLDVGDDASFGRDAELCLCELDDGELKVGPINVGRGATVEVRAGVGQGAKVGDGAVVRALAYVPPGAEVAADSVVAGVPAAPCGVVARAEDPVAGPSWRYTVGVLLLRLAMSALVWAPFSLVAWTISRAFDIDGADVSGWLFVNGPSSLTWLFCLVVATAPVGLLLAVCASALLLRLLPNVAAGTFGRWTWRYWWACTRMRWLEGAGEWLSGTLFWPRWLRLAGMRVERDVEVSSIHDVLPERTSLGGSSFLADGVYLGSPRVSRGRVTVGETSLGRDTFVGNHAVVEQGERMPDGILLGVSTVASAASMPTGTAWFGNPAFRLPRREVVEVDRRLTYEPSALRVLNRLFWESLRFALPALPATVALWWFDVFVAFGFWGALVATGAAPLALALVVLVTKWLLLGRVQPGQHGLWSCWASRWDFHYVLWGRYGRAMLSPLEGTLVLPWFLRAMGMRIGRRCVLGDGFAQVVDPDMITIEDGATVHALFQAHSFEDRVLKIDRVRLGARCTVGRGAVVLYGADVGEGAHVMPHSAVMKRELLLPGRSYAGAPTDEVA
jgi:non-ribosomal peptide synthetase-like protein